MKPTIQKPKKILRLVSGRITFISVVILIGTSTTLLTSFLFLKNQQESFRLQFETDVEQRTFAIEKELLSVKQMMNAINSFYEASKRVDRDEFKKFSGSLLTDNSEVDALYWIPRVPHAWRDAYEGVQNSSGEALGKSFKQAGPGGELTDAPVQEVYHPIFFAEPLEKYGHMLGVDLTADAALWNLLERSKARHSLQASEWFVHEKPGGEKEHFFYMAIPFYRANSEALSPETEPVGYLMSSMRIENILAFALDHFNDKNLDIYISQSKVGPAEDSIFYGNGREASFQYTQTGQKYKTLIQLNIEGQIWYMQIYPRPEYFRTSMSWIPWVILFTGLLLTFLFSAYLWSIYLAKKALDKLNQQLKAEVAERLNAEKKVRASEERIHQIVDLVPQLIYARDRSGRFLLVNKQMAEVYGETVDSLIGKRYQDIHLCQSEIEQCLHDDLIVLDKNQSVTVLEEKFTDISGSERVLQTTKIPYYWDDTVGFVVLGVSIDITERKILENIRLSEERYRGVIEQSVDSILLVKKSGEFVDINQTACEAMGYQRQELLGMSLFDIDPSYNEESLAVCWKQLKEQKKKITESFYVRKNNSTYPVEVSIARIVIRNEEFLLFCARDISQLKRMNRELQKVNTFLDLIFENIPNMVFIKDAKDLRFIRFNKAGADLIGVDREKMIGKNDFDFFPKEEAEFFTQKDKEVIAGGKLVNIPEEPISTKDKQIRYLHTKKIPIFDENRKPIYLLGISEDITDQKLAILRMQQANIAMENALDGIARLNRSAKYTMVNSAFAAMLGSEPDALIGADWSDNIHPQDRGKMKELLEASDKSGKAEGELRAVRKDGSLFYEQVVIIKNQDGHNSDFAYYCFFKDITEKKYRVSIENKSDLISMVSHELRTPLHSIREGISVMLDGLVGEISEDQKDILTTNMVSLDRLTRLVNSFLDFQRLEAGVVEFDVKNHDVNDLIKKVFMEVEVLARAKGLKLKIKTDSKLPLVRCDSDRTSLVLMNLLGNAIKFTPSGEVSVETAVLNNSVKISVRDTGVGIMEEEIPRLFQKFGQLESGKMIAPAGTGLGLAISRKIVEAQHGVLEVQSRYKEGSVFSFTLPLAIGSAHKITKEVLS